ncbi:MAG: NifB/NifX family molybdenum-iron cluster-binding protein [Anaerolineales bacterium]|nr:NifB/NifX family molybdenum-iron cluster-binding protein [Anaerolineales bacterium]
MKIAISVQDEELRTPDPRFGRCQFFVVVDMNNGDVETIPNKSIHDDSGAGVGAAAFLSALGVEKAISGRFGPKAATALQAAGIEMLVFNTGSDLSFDEVLEKFHAGELKAFS